MYRSHDQASLLAFLFGVFYSALLLSTGFRILGGPIGGWSLVGWVPGGHSFPSSPWALDGLVQGLTSNIAKHIHNLSY